MKKRIYNWSALLLMCLLVFGAAFSSCDEGEDLDTNQIKAGDIALNAFGPSPAMRGGELRFIGTNLDKVTSIDLPSAEGITEITKVGKYEIRIIIPQTAEPGLVVLNTPEGKITTKTPIGFSEPISISGMTPLAIKAGAVLSIEGDYLNTVEEVIFADGIHVLKADFKSQTRAKIEVKVPITAQSGKVIVSDGADLLSDGEEIPNLISSEEELAVTLPAFAEHSPETPKAGNTMSISGADLDLVASVRFVDAEVVEFEVAEDAKSLTLEVPATAKDGAASLVAYSGLEVALGDLAFVKPSAVIEEMKEAYGVGEALVLSGSDLDLVTKAAFTNGEETEVSATQDGKINLTVTEAAQSGLITLMLANGATVTVDGFETLKPVAELPADATPLDELDVVSTLGNRVKTVKFGDLEAEATATNDGFKVVIPLEGKSGAVTLVMDNGEEVSAGEITLSLIDFAIFLDINVDVKVYAGSIFDGTLHNSGKLVSVKLNGDEVKYIIVGDHLYLSVGYSIGLNTITLVSDSGKEAEYEFTVIASGIVEEPIWNNGPLLIDWSANRIALKASDFEDVPEGSKLRFYFMDKNGAWGQAQVNNGAWNAIFTLVPSDIAEYNWWEVTNTERYYDVELTSALLKDIKDNQVTEDDFAGAGIIIQGGDLIFSKVTLLIDYSGPVTISDTPTVMGDWNGTVSIPASAFATATVGQVITVVTSDLESGAQGSFKDNDWVAIADGTDYFDISGDFTLTITADILAKLKSGGLKVQGKLYSVVKVTLK